MPPAWPLVCKITGSTAPDSTGRAITCARCLGHQSAKSRAECGCDGTWGMCGAVVFLWHSWAGKDIILCCCQGAVTKDSVQEGTEQRKPAPALLGDGRDPKPTANPQYPRHVP